MQIVQPCLAVHYANLYTSKELVISNAMDITAAGRIDEGKLWTRKSF